jgi:hypothetical protein
VYEYLGSITAVLSSGRLDVTAASSLVASVGSAVFCPALHTAVSSRIAALRINSKILFIAFPPFQLKILTDRDRRGIAEAPPLWSRDG